MLQSTSIFAYHIKSVIMRTNLYLLFLVAFWLGCKPSFKEISDADIEYIEDLNIWRYKSDASTVKDNFVCNDAKYDYDGLSFSFKRVVTVDEDGHMLTLKQYIDDKIIRDGDYKKAPNEYIETIYPENPISMPPYKEQKKIYKLFYTRTATGSTTLIKNNLNTTELEYICDKKGDVEKIYEWKNGKRVVPYSDYFTIENVVTGYEIYSYDLEVCPGVKFKIRNKTGNTITSTLRLDYKFINNDEIIDSGMKLVSSDAGWDNNMTKTVAIRTFKDVGFTNYHNKKLNVKVVVTYEDGSIAYQGKLSIKSEKFE